MSTRMKAVAVLSAAVLAAAAAPAAASAPITYSGSISQARALSHLQGAAPNDVRLRSAASWGTAGAVHYRVVLTRFDPRRVDAAHYARFSSVGVRLNKAGRERAVLFSPTPGSRAQIWCAGSIVGGWYPISVTLSVSAGSIDLAVARTTLAKCGLTKGSFVSADIVSDLDVSGPSQSLYGTWAQITTGAARGLI